MRRETVLTNRYCRPVFLMKPSLPTPILDIPFTAGRKGIAACSVAPRRRRCAYIPVILTEIPERSRYLNQTLSSIWSRILRRITFYSSDFFSMAERFFNHTQQLFAVGVFLVQGTIQSPRFILTAIWAYRFQNDSRRTDRWVCHAWQGQGLNFSCNYRHCMDIAPRVSS